MITCYTQIFESSNITLGKVTHCNITKNNCNHQEKTYFTLIPQHYYKLNFLSTWATKSCSGFCHVRIFTYLSVAKKQENPTIDMAKIQIKSERLTPFGGLFSIMEQFDSTLSSVIDSTLGLRCRSFGYQYSEIIRSLMSIYFCGGYWRFDSRYNP